MSMLRKSNCIKNHLMKMRYPCKNTLIGFRLLKVFWLNRAGLFSRLMID